MELFDVTFRALDMSLGAAGKRQEVLAGNLANVNTPMYKRQDVAFEDTLAKALDEHQQAGAQAPAGDPLAGLAPNVTTDGSTAMRADGNNVDIDMEMSLLAENNVRYNALVQLASKKLNTLEYVISDGRR